MQNMIRLPGGLAVTADSQCYTLGKPVERTSKDGKKSVVLIGANYYTTLAGAVEGAIGRLTRECVADGTITTLAGSVQEITALRGEIADLLADIDA